MQDCAVPVVWGTTCIVKKRRREENFRSWAVVEGACDMGLKRLNVI